MRNVPHTGSYNICGTTPRIITCNQDGRPGLLGRIVLPRNGRDRLDLDQQLGLAQSVHLDDRAGGRAVREQLLAQRAGASCARLGSDPDSWHDDAGDTLRPQRGCRDCLPGPGRGAFDVVFIPGSISHVEVYWGRRVWRPCCVVLPLMRGCLFSISAGLACRTGSPRCPPWRSEAMISGQ
jgi:hypothetical protein